MTDSFTLRECWFCNKTKPVTEYFYNPTKEEINICIKCTKLIHPEVADEIENKRAVVKFRNSKELKKKILWMFFNTIKNTIPNIKERLDAKGVIVPKSRIDKIISDKLKGI